MARPKQVAAHVGPTICRSAASPPHERFVDVTPMSLRRDRPLQRLVRRRYEDAPTFTNEKVLQGEMELGHGSLRP
jgi:hypothetical protein